MTTIKTLRLLRKRLKQSEKLAKRLRNEPEISENVGWSLNGIRVAMEKARRHL